MELTNPVELASNKLLEVHEHWFVSGPRARHWNSEVRRIKHSHPGGNVAHQHEHTGPASYTIDKDEWRPKTGLRGGGRKKFTKRPTGEQFSIVELEDWQKSFTVIIAGPPTPERGEGPGIALPEHIAQTFNIPYEVEVEL